jgi:hypothetical protein
MPVLEVLGLPNAAPEDPPSGERQILPAAVVHAVSQINQIGIAN